MSQPTDRIQTLDILRGFALLGMILVHFHQRFRLTTTLETFPGEWLVGWVVWLGVEQKAWGTFAFLFGVGFAILMRRFEARGQSPIAPYLRRMAVLFAIGALIYVFTDFVMLMEYAVWGCVLLMVRKAKTPVLLGAALAAAVASIMIRLGRAPAPEALTYAQLVAERLQALPEHASRLWKPGSSFVLFIAGLLAVRYRVFDEPRRHSRLIGGALAFGLISWLVYWLVLERVSWGRYGVPVFHEQWLALTYVGALTLLLTWRPQWTARLAVFGAAGRMALTNYVLQCAVIEYLASPFGLGLALRPYYYVFGAVVLFGGLAALSTAWLARYDYGPLEWLWRRATYLRRLPRQAELAT